MKDNHMVMDIRQRLGDLDWREIEESLWDRGCAKTPPLLTTAECDALTALYDDKKRFHCCVDMAKYCAGQGEYRAFANPLPTLVSDLRTNAYPPLVSVANRWMEALGLPETYPNDHEAFLDYCRRQGQTEPTPALLKHEAGGYNCLHQDIFGEIWFPVQFVIFLSRRGQNYTGGEFLLIEKTPSGQLRGEAITPEQGEIVFFTTRYRPTSKINGCERVNVWHGVSTVRSGLRLSLGVAFHNASRP